MKRLAPAGAIVVLAYVLAFVQRPGRVFLDTRIELTVDPVRFLHSVVSMWSSTGDLGHVQSGQFVGYLVPMAPWYAFAHAVGLSGWVAERIWLGTLLAACGVGAMVALRQLYPRSTWIAQAVAAVLFMANPYVVVVIGRTSVWLLMYACVPWLLVATHRGLRDPRRWRWPAIVGLLVLVANGGANVALTFWILLAPPALLAYEVLVVRDVRWRDAGAFALRATVCTVVSSLWWLVPVLLQSRYGTNPLAFTEQPSGILATPSVSESFRLLGYWLAYFGGAPGPAVGAAHYYLFDPAVIIATFLVPLAAIGGFVRTRGWSYAPFMMLLLVAGVLAMSLGFPPGSPMNRVFVSLYGKSAIVQVLRTTWKAAPLAALPLACLAGLWAEAVIRQARTATGLQLRRIRIPVWALVVLVPVPILWGLPLFAGTAVDPWNAYGSIPSYWRAATRDATRATTANQRIMILPGELFGWYRWGDTGDSVAPYLTPRRVAIRELARFADPRSSQLLTTVDNLVEQNRLVPGQLTPLLQLLGVGAVLVPADGNIAGDGSIDPADAAAALRDQTSFVHPVQTYGSTRTYTPMPGRDGPAVSLPDLRRYALPGTGPGVVRVQPLAGTTILDGDGSGITELAADGMLEPTGAVVYAGDLHAALMRRLLATGARLVISDSNRRQILGASSLSANLGPTLAPGDPISVQTPSYNLFPARGSAGQTVAQYSGLSVLRTPALHAATAFFPANAPSAALDGQLDTAWLADAQAAPSQRWIELRPRSPLPVRSIRIYPLSELLGATTQVGITVNHGRERLVSLARGWNTVSINAPQLRALRVRISRVDGLGSAGGISELQVPGLQVREALRLPTDLARATGGQNLGHNEITVLLARTTADFPYREQTAPGDLQALSVVGAADAESGIRRIVTLPIARTFTVGGWASVRAAAPDPLLDRLARLAAGWRFSSSDRFEGVPINRASSAFDRDPSTAWVARFVEKRVFPWIQWSSPRPRTIRRLQLTPGAPQYDFPNRVRITAPGAPPQDLVVTPDGSVTLLRAIHARTVRLTVTNVRFPIGTREFNRYLNAVAIAQIRVPGLAPPAPARSGTFHTACGALAITTGGASRPLEVYGTLAALDHGEPLRLRSCGRPGGLTLAAGSNLVDVSAGAIMQPDHIALDSPAPDPLLVPAAPRLLSAGSAVQGSQRGVRLSATAPTWLVLGESYSDGWHAWCRDASGRETALGAAVPINGYANGWQAPAGCVTARMAFAPQGTANLVYVISVLATVVLIALALGLKLPRRVRDARARRRPPSARDTSAPPAVPAEDGRVGEAEPVTLRVPAAVACGLVVGALTGFVFAIRFGVVAAAATVVLLVAGVSVRRLLVLSAAGMIAIPILYIAHPAPNFGGFSFYFSLHQILSHWIGAGVLCALLAAALLDVRALRARARRTPSIPLSERAPVTPRSEISAPEG